jgi:hypothetical protein
MQSKGRGLFWGVLMSLMELFQDAASPIAAVQGQYLLQGQHFAAGDAVTECSTTLRSAVTRNGFGAIQPWHHLFTSHPYPKPTPRRFFVLTASPNSA